jgi:hypothetical protein
LPSIFRGELFSYNENILGEYEIPYYGKLIAYLDGMGKIRGFCCD